MPFAMNPEDGVRLHYVVEGDAGPAVVMQYGFMGYIDAWYAAGYVEALSSEFRLAVFDPRGTEQSDRPHDPKWYRNERLAGDVIAILDAVGVETGHFWGYSRGGRIGYELALNHGERINSVVIGAMHPYRRDPEQFAEQIDLFSMGWDRSIPLWEERNGPLDPEAREQLLRNDSQALAAASIATRDAPGLDDQLDEIVTPTLIYAGDRDTTFYEPAKRAAAAMPGARFVSLPGLDHGTSFATSDIVVPIVRAFLRQQSSDRAATS